VRPVSIGTISTVSASHTLMTAWSKRMSPTFVQVAMSKKGEPRRQKKQQQQLQQQTSQAAGSAPAGKSPRQLSSSSQPLQNQITGSKLKMNRRSPEKEIVRKNINMGNATSKVVNCQPNTSRKTSSSSRGGRMSPKHEGNIDGGLGEEEMNLAIEEVKRQGGTSSPGVVVAVERLPTVNTTIEGYSAIPTNPWDNLNHIEEVVVEKEVEMEEDSEEEEEEQQFRDKEMKTEPAKSLGEVTGLQEEEAWLQAVESGNLQQVYSCDSELRSVREPSQLTARQRALGGEDGAILSQLEFGSRAKDKVVSELTEEEKNVKALKRKEMETEKRERQKQKTMDTLLKKKDSKATKQIKTSKSNRSDIPKISYVANSSGALLSLPEGFEYPLEASRGVGSLDKMKPDVKSGRVKRMKREQWVVRSLKLKKESEANNDSLLLGEDDVVEVETVILAEIAAEEKEDAKMAAVHHGNSYLGEAQNFKSGKECWVVKSLKLEKENNCRGPCPGQMKEEDTDVEEVGVIYLGEVVEEESDGSISPFQQDYIQSPGENLWESDLEINM